MTVTEIITVLCADLAENSRLQNYIDLAEESINSTVFGSMTNQAVALKACHLYQLFDANSEMAKMDSIGGGSGAVTSYSEGGISIGFASGDTESELSSTKYGRMLLALMKSIPKMNVNRLGVVGSL